MPEGEERAKPSHVRFASIPRNFKGAILVKELKRDGSRDGGEGGLRAERGEGDTHTHTFVWWKLKLLLERRGTQV